MKSSMPLVRDEFVMGYRQQEEWAWLISTAFFMGKVGGGMFLIALLIGFPLAAMIGLWIVAVGKSVTHLIYLGRPLRCWRILAKPWSSWISRGIWAMAIFVLFGLLYLAPYFSWLSWLPISEGSGAWQVFRIIAILGVFVVMVYDGFVMNASPAISLWNTALMPVLCLFYSLLGGMTTNLFLLHLGVGNRGLTAGTLQNGEIVLIVTNFIIVITYLLSMFYSSSGSKESVLLLVRGRYARAFWLGVILIGFMLTLLLSLFVSGNESALAVISVLAADLIGHFVIFFLLLRAGVYTPVLGKLSF